MRLLKNKIANPLLAVLISIKVAASQVENLLDPLHLLEGEERAASSLAQSRVFLKVGIVLRNCKQAQRCVKRGMFDISPFQCVRSWISASLVEGEAQN